MYRMKKKLCYSQRKLTQNSITMHACGSINTNSITYWLLFELKDSESTILTVINIYLSFGICHIMLVDYNMSIVHVYLIQYCLLPFNIQ